MQQKKKNVTKKKGDRRPIIWKQLTQDGHVHKFLEGDKKKLRGNEGRENTNSPDGGWVTALGDHT